MLLLRLLKEFRFIAVVAILLLLCSCATSTPPAGSEGDTAPAISPPLNSPLVDFARQLASDKNAKNHVELLEIGQEALLARIHLIRSARRSITIQTMIWVNDETGRYLIYELIQAARRGVKVRLLIDHLASEQDIDVAGFLANVHPNFQIKLFNPVTGFLGQKKAEPSMLDKLYAVLFTFKRLNQRMHNKTFIVDGRIGITGGRNYQNAYYDQARGMNYKDRDLLVIGPVVKDMQQSFDAFWSYDRSIAIGSLSDVKHHPDKEIGQRWLSRESFQLNGFFSGMDAQADEPELIERLFIAPLTPVAQASFVADAPTKRGSSLLHRENESKITLALADMVSTAENSVTIQTPYLVLSSQAIKLFRDLREKHPEIDLRISTNSLAATDSWYVYALSYKQKKTYLSDLRFHIYEIKPLPGDMPDFMPSYPQLQSRALRLASEEAESAVEAGSDSSTTRVTTPYFCVHAKSLVVDEQVAFVGSYNLDPRSENLNTECGLVIRDAGFARLLKETIKRDMQPQNAWVIAPKKYFLGVDETNAILVELSHLIPIVDPWPFRYTASFELKEGRTAVEIDDPDFYKNYRDVGSFPQVGTKSPVKVIGAFGTKSFLSFVKPLL